MKKVFISLMCVLLSATLFTVSANNNQKDPYMTKKFPASSIKEVEVATAGGSITINGDASSEAVVEVYLSQDKRSSEEIQKYLDENYTIEIKVENGKLYAIAKAKSNIREWRNSLSISFKISVAKQANTQLKTSGGSIHISNLSGSQDFATSGGSLNVENLSGKILGRTSGGSITVSGSKDDIDLHTSGGSINASDCSGKIVLKTSGGSLKLQNLNGTIDASTSGGSVNASNISGTLKTGTSGGSVNIDDISGNVEASTSGGSMNVKMKSVNEFVKLSTSGNLTLSLPSGKGYNVDAKANKIETSGLKDFRGNMEDKSMSGTVGNGGAKVELRSSQRINLSFQ